MRTAYRQPWFPRDQLVNTLGRWQGRVDGVETLKTTNFGRNMRFGAGPDLSSFGIIRNTGVCTFNALLKAFGDLCSGIFHTFS